MRWEGGKESENLEDRRRIRPAGAAAGGGVVLLLALVVMLMGGDPRQILRLLQNAPVQAPGGGAGTEEPESADDVRSRKFAATILGYTEEVWGDLFQQNGKTYEPPKMVLFTERVETGCGVAPSAVGPFYCPNDRTVYLDPSFFDELEQKLGGSHAEFSQAYVIAHEIGHHVQNLLGYSDRVHRQRLSLSDEEGNQLSVRLELQADYLAGVWAHYGQRKFNFIEPGDVESAIQSANAIGDDRLQKRSTGFVSPERFTHGTSAQRVKWFTHGLKTGDLKSLDEIFKMPYESL